MATVGKTQHSSLDSSSGSSSSRTTTTTATMMMAMMHAPPCIDFRRQIELGTIIVSVGGIIVLSGALLRLTFTKKGSSSIPDRCVCTVSNIQLLRTFPHEWTYIIFTTFPIRILKAKPNLWWGGWRWRVSIPLVACTYPRKTSEFDQRTFVGRKTRCRRMKALAAPQIDVECDTTSSIARLRHCCTLRDSQKAARKSRKSVAGIAGRSRRKKGVSKGSRAIILATARPRVFFPAGGFERLNCSLSKRQ